MEDKVKVYCGRGVFTCIECEFPFDDLTGDTEERMCNDCIEAIEDKDYKREVR